MKNIGVIIPSLATLAVVGLVVYILFKLKGPAPRKDEAPASNALSRSLDNAVSFQTGVEGDSLGTAVNRGFETVGNWFSSAATWITGKPSYYDPAQAQRTREALAGLNKKVPATVNPSVSFPVNDSFWSIY